MTDRIPTQRQVAVFRRFSGEFVAVLDRQAATGLALRSQVGRVDAFRSVHPSDRAPLDDIEGAETRALDAHARVVDALDRAWKQIHGLIETPEQIGIAETRRALEVAFTSLQQFQREADEQVLALTRALDRFSK